MRKLFLLISIVLLLVSFSGCITVMPGSPYVYGTKHITTIEGTEITYDVYTNYFEDLEHPFYTIETVFSMEDAYEILKDDVMSLTIYYTSEGFNMGQFEITYEGSSWRFMEGNMRYKVDETLYSFIDESPKRNVLSGGDVEEKISNYPLVLEKDSDFLTDIRTCKSIIVQYHGEPYTFDQKEVLIVNDFFSKYFDMSYDEIKRLHNQQ